MRTGDAAPFVAAALAGLSAHPAEGTRTPDDTAARAVALGIATADALAKRIELDVEPDSERPSRAAAPTVRNAKGK